MNPESVPEGAVAHPYLARTRSFTRRGGRMPERHQAAYDALAPSYVIDVPRDGGTTTVDPAYSLDVAEAFGRAMPLIVEVGPGSGDALVAGAKALPDNAFVALEVWRPGIGQCLARLVTDPLPNIRFIEADAEVALATMLGENTVAEVWTYFPDPWPKRKQQHRRIGAAGARRGGMWGAGSRGHVAAGHRHRQVCHPHAQGAGRPRKLSADLDRASTAATRDAFERKAPLSGAPSLI